MGRPCRLLRSRGIRSLARRLAGLCARCDGASALVTPSGCYLEQARRFWTVLHRLCPRHRVMPYRPFQAQVPARRACMLAWQVPKSAGAGSYHFILRACSAGSCPSGRCGAVPPRARWPSLGGRATALCLRPAFPAGRCWAPGAIAAPALPVESTVMCPLQPQYAESCSGSSLTSHAKPCSGSFPPCCKIYPHADHTAHSATRVHLVDTA